MSLRFLSHQFRKNANETRARKKLLLQIFRIPLFTVCRVLLNLINTLFRSFPLHYCNVLLNLEVPNFGTVLPKILENLNTNNSLQNTKLYY